MLRFFFLMLVVLALVACNNSVEPSAHATPVDAVAVPEQSSVSEQAAPVEAPLTGADLIRSLIPEKETLSKRLWDHAETINDQFHIGTMYNEVDVPQHLCYITGVLLGKQHAVRSVEVTYKPDLVTRTDDNAHELRVMGQSLSNFVHVAKSQLQKSADERKIEWNLDCVGKHGISRSEGFEKIKQSTFYKLQDETTIQVLGDIEEGFAQRLIDAIEKNPKVDTVALGSGGGYVDEAIRAGLYIREKGLKTALWNNCYSACPLVFLGGTERVIWSPYPTLGFHQVYDSNFRAVPLDSSTYRGLASYVGLMGADPEFVIRMMWSAGPSQMAEVESLDDLCDHDIVTWIQRACNGRSATQ